MAPASVPESASSLLPKMPFFPGKKALVDVMALNYMHKFFDILPSKKVELNSSLLELGLDLVTHF